MENTTPKIKPFGDRTNKGMTYKIKKAKGYSYDKTRGLYKVRFTLDRKEVNVGYAYTEKKAKEMYNNARKKYGIE